MVGVFQDCETKGHKISRKLTIQAESLHDCKSLNVIYRSAHTHTHTYIAYSVNFRRCDANREGVGGGWGGGVGGRGDFIKQKLHEAL